jgi:hypothetical protein
VLLAAGSLSRAIPKRVQERKQPTFALRASTFAKATADKTVGNLRVAPTCYLCLRNKVLPMSPE